MALLSARLKIGRVNAERLHWIGADTLAPTAPSGLTATPTARDIVLTWGAATDFYGVVGYQVWHCAGAGCTTFTHLASVNALEYRHTGLPPSSTHRYQVRAYDAVSNLGPFSAIATATTADRPPLTQVYLLIGGTWQNVSAYARVAGATVTQALNEVLDTASLRFDGSIPYPLQGAPLVIANADGVWEFAGPITAVRTVYEGRAANVAYDVDAVDWTWFLSARKVTARYTGWTVGDIFFLLITNFAPAGFTLDVSGLAANPVLDEITFTNEDLPQAFSRTCERGGAYWYADVNKVIRVFQSGAVPSAGTIDQTACQTAAKLASHADGASVVTRVHARGGGAAAASDAAPGQTTLPVVDGAWYSATGGLVECGPQRLSYAGVAGISETGSTMGLVSGPSMTPGGTWGTFEVFSVQNQVQPGGSTDLAPGTYLLAITNLTSRGESAPLVFTATVLAGHNAFQLYRRTAPLDPGVTRFKVYTTVTPGDVFANLKSLTDTPQNGFAYSGFDLVMIANDPRYGGPPSTVSTAGETSLTTPAGSSTVSVEDVGPFPASGWAEAPGGQLLRYTGKSATSGAGTLTGIPAAGIGAITAALRSGTIRSVPHLIGIPASGAGAIVYPIKAGDEVLIFVVREDAAAIAALAAATGGDGLRLEFLTDGRLALVELSARAEALLAMRKAPLVTVTFETRDPAVAVGKTITFATTAPPITGTFLVQRVQLSEFPARGSRAGTPPRRVVEASSRRYTFEDLVQQIKLLGRIN